MKVKQKSFLSFFSESSKIIILGYFCLTVALIFIGVRLPSFYITMPSESRTLQVQGFAKKSVPADSARWNLILEVSHQDYPTALLQAANESDIIIGFLEKNGFENNKDIEKQLPSIQIEALPSSLQNAPEGPLYTIQIPVTVTSRDIHKIRATYPLSEELILRGIFLKENNIYYGLQTPNAYQRHQEKLHAAALENAEKVAKYIAKKAGIELGAIRTIHYDSMKINGQMHDQTEQTLEKTIVPTKQLSLAATVTYTIHPQ